VLKLPPKIYKTVDVPLTSQQSKLLDSLNSYFKLEFGKVKIDTEYIFTLISKSLEICDGFVKDNEGNTEIVPTHKDEMLFELLEEIDPLKHKVVIWCNFKFSVSKIVRLLKKVGWNHVVLTGDTENANMVVNKFQHSKDCNILVATLKKASESITLTSCNYAIYYSNIWSYDYRANSEARIFRKGSEHHKHVIYTDLVTKGSIEEKVLLCLKNKKKLINVLKEQFTEVREYGKG
jgi:SNF2 family DNA or RNA helicase